MVNKRVLVADDEIHIVHVVAIKLRNNSYDVISAENGAEAFERACEEKPDIIVTDYQMPVMTGLELCGQLRALDVGRDIPTIMLTARGFDIEPAQMAEAGIVAVLAKPFSPRELLAKVNEMLAESPNPAKPRLS